METVSTKLENLKNILRQCGSVAVAFSSGVDSTFLLKVAHDTLGKNAVAITIKSRVVPNREIEEGRAFCRTEGIHQIIVDIDEMSIEGFAKNSPDRCYLCKKAIFSKIQGKAIALGFQQVCEGSNVDDEGDYRPGMKAIAELGVLSPLREARLSKAEIRELSRQLGLPTWDKPSFACLASRVPYGEPITEEKLQRVEAAEQFLLDLGLSQFRVRIHGDMARIEILPQEFEKLLRVRERVLEYFYKIGFSYVSLDLEGFRSGSLNKPIQKYR